MMKAVLSMKAISMLAAAALIPLAIHAQNGR
jgi:hypothetical protein